jgi:hypothetical protein
MSTKSSVRFTIFAGEAARTLFSVSENKKSSLTLRIKRMPRLTLPGQPVEIAPAEVLSQKYSIHASQDSEHGINYVHHTAVLDEGLGPLESTFVTRALKNEGAFTRLYTQRCGDLRRAAFISKGTAPKTVSLGCYNPDHFTLIYVVLASAPSTAFECAPDYVNIAYQDFKIARITVLWTFLALPSGDALTAHHHRAVIDDPELFDDGSSAEECVIEFLEERHTLEHHHRAYVLARLGAAVDVVLVPPIRYFRKGDEQTEVSSKYMETLKRRLRVANVSFGRP